MPCWFPLVMGFLWAVNRENTLRLPALLWCFVTLERIKVAEAICPQPEWQEQQLIKVEEALPMMTINGAYALFREDGVGSLEPGKFADKIILSDSPLEVNPGEITGFNVLMTLVSSRTALSVSSHKRACP